MGSTKLMPLLLSLAIITFATGFHLHWALGGRTGFSVSLPQHPNGAPVMADRIAWWRPAAGAVALCLIVLAALLSARAEILPLSFPPRLLRLMLLSIGAAFVARSVMPNRYVGLFKTIRATRWAKYDTRLYSPLFLLLGLLVLWQAR